MRWRSWASFGLCVSLIALVNEHPAAAHDPAVQYPSKWPAPTSAQQFSFTPSVPTAYKAAVVAGAQPWNDRGERTWFFPGPDVNDFPSHGSGGYCTTLTSNAIHVEPLDGAGGAAAYTYDCSIGSVIINTQIQIDQAEAWYSGTGTPPWNQIDLQSAMTHEWGHATGAAHLTGSDVCAPGYGPSDETMCPGFLYGTTYARTLGPHDIHTFENAYPPTWFLANANAPSPPLVTPFGYTGTEDSQTVACDWNGDGTSTPGAYLSGQFYLRNSNTEGGADVAPFFWGVGGDRPICGDWNGDGIDTIGLYRPSTQQFFLNDQNDNSPAESTMTFGSPGDVPLAGNWDGSTGLSSSTVGIYRPSTQQFFLKTYNDASATNVGFAYGIAGDLPVTGNWDGTTTNRTDTVGIYRNGTWYMNDQNDSSPSEHSLAYGGGLDVPITGNWDGSATNKTDTPGIVRGL